MTRTVIPFHALRLVRAHTQVRIGRVRRRCEAPEFLSALNLRPQTNYGVIVHIRNVRIGADCAT